MHSFIEGAISFDIDVLSNDYDSDGDSLTLQQTTEALYGTVVVSTANTLSYTPKPDYCGLDTFEYQIADDDLNLATARVTVRCLALEPQILQPVVEVNSGLNVQEEFQVVAANLASDLNHPLGDLWVVLDDTASSEQMGNQQNITTQYGRASVINHDGWGHTPNHFKGQILYVAEVSDGAGKVDVVRYKLRNPDGLMSEDWGELRISLDGSFHADYDYFPVDDQFRLDVDVSQDLHVIANDPEPEIWHSIEIHQQPKLGSVSVNSDNTITYTANGEQIGSDSFQYRTTGNNLYSVNSAPATVTVYVASSNTTPEANDDVLVTLGDDSSVVLDVIENDTDADEDALWLLSVGNASFGTTEWHSNRTVSYTPAPGYCGPDSFSYTATDRRFGGEVIAQVEVNCEPLGPKGVDDVLHYKVGDMTVELDVIANDVSSQGGLLSLLSVGEAQIGVTEWKTNRTLSYTPEPGYCGEDSFTYTVSESGVDHEGVGRVTARCVERPEGVFVASPVDVMVGQPIALNWNILESTECRLNIEGHANEVYATADSTSVSLYETGAQTLFLSCTKNGVLFHFEQSVNVEKLKAPQNLKAN